jgi:uncharacterized protein
MRRQAPDLSRDYSHIQRVWQNAQRIATAAAENEDWNIDGDTLEASCLLHEIGRGHERPGESASEACARIAEKMLRNEGLRELIWPTCEAIITHVDRSRTPETLEAKILRDADNLEDLGAIGLARTIAQAVAAATPLFYDMDDPAALERPIDPGTHILDRLPAMHFPLADNMYTSLGATEAARLGRVLVAYYEAFLKEAGYPV